MVLLLRALDAAFLIFFLAAALCLALAMFFNLLFSSNSLATSMIEPGSTPDQSGHLSMPF
jgi:hypothetical protein